MTKKNIFECSAVINGCEIELTNHCYLDCIGCIRKECNDFGFMTFDIFKSVINNVEKIGYEEIVLSGLGDVFLHKDLYTFIDYIFFKIPNIKIYIMTKGQTLSIQDIDRFLEYKNNGFNIGLTFSIFSLSKKVYTSVTGGGNLVNLLDIIKYSYNKKINFSFEFLINKNNINSINNFKKFTKLFGKEFMYSIPHNWGGDLKTCIYEDIFNFNVLDSLIVKRKNRDMCEAIISKYLFFDYKGNIYKCGFKRLNNELLLGNVLVDFDFEKNYKILYVEKCNKCSFYYYRTLIELG